MPKGFGPTLAGSGRCREYIDEPICTADEQCSWRKGYQTKTGHSISPLCVVKRAKLVMGPGGRGTGTELQKAAAAANPWILHVKKYAQQNGLTYREALKKAAATYQKKMKGGYYDEYY